MSDKAQNEPIDYTAMTEHEMVNSLSDDAMKWAKAFCQFAKKMGYGDIDEDWAVGWFANAIEHSSDVRYHRSQPQTKPVINDFPED